MSNDLIVPPVAAAVAASESAGQAKAAVSTAVMEPKQPVASSVGPNPSLQLDPALGLVVIEFRNDAGAVTSSIPSERQLQAYQRWAATHFGPAPPGMPATGVSTAPVRHHHEMPAPAAGGGRDPGQSVSPDAHVTMKSHNRAP
jgi:hypothetical protein